jgi:hypothetical protein
MRSHLASSGAGRLDARRPDPREPRRGPLHGPSRSSRELPGVRTTDP